MRIRITITLGLALILAGGSVLLSQRSTRLAGKNPAAVGAEMTRAAGGERVCQAREVLPRATDAIRLSLKAAGPGPSLRVTATRNGKVLTRGVRARGWHGSRVAIAVEAVERTATGVKVCVRLGSGASVALLGDEGRRVRSFATIDGEYLRGQLEIEYLRSGYASWWSYAPTLVHRVGLGRTWTGPWAALLAVAFMIAAGGCALAWLVREQTPRPATTPDPPHRLAGVRALLGRVPTAGWMCALVAVLNAAAWALITPPFQVPDEQDHFAYVQRLAETGRPPSTSRQRYSSELAVVLARLRFRAVAAQAGVGIWSNAEQRQLDRALATRPERRGIGGAGTAMLQPPLFYALEAVPYRLARSATLLDRLALMRLLSVLLAGSTALLVFLFVREVLPSTPWAWTVGALALALQPLFGYTSSAVNPDSLLYACSAALFYCVARGFRRGLTARLAIAIGAILAIGLITKLNFVGLVPGAALALVLLALRCPPGFKLRALGLSTVALAIGIAALGAIALLNADAWGRPALGGASGAGEFLSHGSPQEGSLLGYLDYTWQFFLPPLPGMTPHFPAAITTQQIWFNGFVGLFGWINIVQPTWVYHAALLPAYIALALLFLALFRGQIELRGRLAELTTYAAMAAGIVAEIGAASYTLFLNNAGTFAQSRYLLPLAALFAAALTLAARAGGARWGPAIGALIVMTVLAHDIGSQLHVVSKWYA
jgi:hypothetical protein